MRKLDSLRTRIGPYTVWAVAVTVYVINIAGRTSMGVAGLVAMERFSITASTLALFTVLQLALYAGMQIPVGLILDKVGAKKVLCTGALMMALGQVILGLATSVPVALGARILIGAGDSTAFVSVLRLIPSWFPARRIPLLTQLTGQVGALGQVISSIPFAYVLNRAGWGPAFILLALLAVVTCVFAFIFISDRPLNKQEQKKKGGQSEKHFLVLGRKAEGEIPTLGQTLREPGVKLAFWTHFSTCCPAVVFPLLWGVPFLQIVNGWSPESASAVLVVQTLIGLPLGPLVGRFVAYHPLRRSWVVICTIAITLSVWIAILAFPDGAPSWLIVLLMAVLALNSAASAIAFDFARTSVDPRRISTATGVANMGGFTAALIVAWLIGLILDLQARGEPYTAVHYRVAMLAQACMIVVGLVGIVHYRRKTRQQMARGGVVVPPLREVYLRWRESH